MGRRGAPTALKKHALFCIQRRWLIDAPVHSGAGIRKRTLGDALFRISPADIRKKRKVPLS